MTGPEIALQAALVAALRADAAVAALVGTQVFDEVPADGALPAAARFLHFESMDSRRDPSGDGACRPRLFAITLRLAAVTPDFGAKSAWAIADAARACLDLQTPALAAPWRLNAPLECIRALDVRGIARPKMVFLTIEAQVVEDI